MEWYYFVRRYRSRISLVAVDATLYPNAKEAREAFIEGLDPDEFEFYCISEEDAKRLKAADDAQREILEKYRKEESE